MPDRDQIADDIWQAFKHWEGERKFALRQVVRWLKAQERDAAPTASRDMPDAKDVTKENR